MQRELPVRTSRLLRLSWVFSRLLGLLLFVVADGMAEESTSRYKFGVFPYLPSVQLEDVYTPISADFSRALARNVQFRTSSTFATFAENLHHQAYDIAFVQPFFYATIASAAGYVPLARVDSMLAGIIVVSQKSPLQTLQSLRGKLLALPPVTAAVSHLAKIALRQGGLDPERDLMLRHVPSHAACIHQLIIKKAHACVTASSPLRMIEKKKNVQFRILATTPTIPSSLFVAHHRVPVSHRTTLQRTMVSWHQSDRGRELLQRVQFPRFVPAIDTDYDVVRQYWKEILQTCSRDCP